jgi:hypothetical protein
MGTATKANTEKTFRQGSGVIFVQAFAVFVWVSVTKAMLFALSFACAESHRLHFLRD